MVAAEGNSIRHQLLTLVSVSSIWFFFQALPLQDRHRNHSALLHGHARLHHGHRLGLHSAHPAAAEEHTVPLRLQVQEVVKVLLVEVRQSHLPVSRLAVVIFFLIEKNCSGIFKQEHLKQEQKL